MYALATNYTVPHTYTTLGEQIIINNADIINNSSPYIETEKTYYTVLGATYGALGLAPLSYNSIVRNNGNIDMNGKNAVAVYAKGNVYSTNDHIIINNDKGVAVYGNYSVVGPWANTYYDDHVASISEITTNRLEVNGDNGAVLY